MSYQYTNKRLAPPPDIAAKQSGMTAPARVPKVIPSTAQVPPFWQFKPPTGVDFYFNTTGTLAAGAGSTLILTGTPEVRLTADYEGVIASVNIFVDAITTAWGGVFSVLLNGAPAQGWASLSSFPRNANSISISFDGPLQIPPNTLVTVLVTNTNAGGPWTVGVEVTGWSWAVYDRLQVFGGG